MLSEEMVPAQLLLLKRHGYILCWTSVLRHYLVHVTKRIIFSWHHREKTIEKMHFKPNYCLKIKQWSDPVRNFSWTLRSASLAMHVYTQKNLNTHPNPACYRFLWAFYLLLTAALSLYLPVYYFNVLRNFFNET